MNKKLLTILFILVSGINILAFIFCGLSTIVQYNKGNDFLTLLNGFLSVVNLICFGYNVWNYRRIWRTI